MDIIKLKEELKNLLNENIEIGCLSAKEFNKKEDVNFIKKGAMDFADNREDFDFTPPQNGYIIFCKCDNNLVSFLQFLTLEDKKLFIVFVYVDKSFRKMGLFEKMFNYLKNIGKKKHFNCILSKVDKINPGSIKAHERLGFDLYKEDEYLNYYIFKLN